MARIHSRKRGKHGSKKPTKDMSPSWLKYKPEEIKKIILDLNSKGMQSSQIGSYLRDVYGVPNTKIVSGKKMIKLLKEEKIEKKLPEDLTSLMKRAIIMRKHLEKHKKDLHSKRGLKLTESKILRLVRYYKTRKVLPQGWRYEPKEIELLVE